MDVTTDGLGTSPWPELRLEREYCRLIAQMGQPNCTSLTWWASFVSSKNFGASDLWSRITSPDADRQAPKLRPGPRVLARAVARHVREILWWSSFRRRGGLDRPPPIAGSSRARAATPVLLMTYLDSRAWPAAGQGYADPYWNAFLDHLDRRGVPWIVVGHTLGDPTLVRSKLLEQTPVDRRVFPLEAFLAPQDAVRALAIALTDRPSIPGTALFDGRDIAPILSKQLEDDRYGGQVLRNLCLYFAQRRMLRLLAPRAVFWPWENHSWERLLVLAARKERPEIPLIAHQHATIPLFLLNHFPGELESSYAPFPTRILTTGEEPRRILEAYGHFPADCLGVGCALRYGYLHSGRRRESPLKRPPTIGLALGIDLGVTLGMLQMTAATPSLGHLPVLLRYHPALGASFVAPALGHPLPDGFSASTSVSLADFLEECDLILYSETTVSLEAAILGIPCIYIDLGKGPLGDPMFGSDALKWTASSPDSLARAIDAIVALDGDALERRRLAAHEFVEGYFHPVTEDRMDRFLEPLTPGWRAGGARGEAHGARGGGRRGEDDR